MLLRVRASGATYDVWSIVRAGAGAGAGAAQDWPGSQSRKRAARNTQSPSVFRKRKVKSFTNYMAHTAILISVFLALSETPVYTARPWIRASASRGVPVSVPVFAETHRAYPRRDSTMARLGWPGRGVVTERDGLPLYPLADGHSSKY